jgi:hypothetical protein
MLGFMNIIDLKLRNAFFCFWNFRQIKEALIPSRIATARQRVPPQPEIDNSGARNQYLGPGGPVIGM